MCVWKQICSQSAATSFIYSQLSFTVCVSGPAGLLLLPWQGGKKKKNSLTCEMRTNSEKQMTFCGHNVPIIPPPSKVKVRCSSPFLSSATAVNSCRPPWDGGRGDGGSSVCVSGQGRVIQGGCTQPSARSAISLIFFSCSTSCTL